MLVSGLTVAYSIGNFVWLDANRNATQDFGEEGIAGVVVKLFRGSNGSVVTNIITDSGGYYRFNNLPEGSYYAEFLLPSGYEFTQENAFGLSGQLRQ